MIFDYFNLFLYINQAHLPNTSIFVIFYHNRLNKKALLLAQLRRVIIFSRKKLKTYMYNRPDIPTAVVLQFLQI